MSRCRTPGGPRRTRLCRCGVSGSRPMRVRVGRAAPALRRRRRPLPSRSRRWWKRGCSTGTVSGRRRPRDTPGALRAMSAPRRILGCGSPIIAVAPALIEHLDRRRARSRRDPRVGARAAPRRPAELAQLAIRALAGLASGGVVVESAASGRTRGRLRRDDRRVDRLRQSVCGVPGENREPGAGPASRSRARRIVGARPAPPRDSDPELWTAGLEGAVGKRFAGRRRLVVALALAIAGAAVDRPAALATPLEAVDDSATASIAAQVPSWQR